MGLRQEGQGVMKLCEEPVEVPTGRFDRVLTLANSVVQIACALTLIWFSLSIRDASKILVRFEEQEAKRVADEKDQSRVGAEARQRYLDQQAQMVVLQKQFKDSLETNIRLSEELQRKLREKP